MTDETLNKAARLDTIPVRAGRHHHPGARGLYDHAMVGREENLWQRLEPWISDNGQYITGLCNRLTDPRWLSVERDADTLCQLYALSRVNDLFLWWCSPSEDNAWKLGLLSDRAAAQNDHAQFAAAVGMAQASPADFCPSRHEIVSVEPASDPDHPIEIVETYWLGLMAGPLVFARAGVRVRAGRRHVDPDVAMSAPLFWAYCRRGRPTQDLSDGWGSNSQWSTLPRCDYLMGDTVYLNVLEAEKHDSMAEEIILDDSSTSDDPAPGTPEFVRLRDELLLHRTPITIATTNSADLWPYNLHGQYNTLTSSLAPLTQNTVQHHMGTSQAPR